MGGVITLPSEMKRRDAITKEEAPKLRRDGDALSHREVICGTATHWIADDFALTDRICNLEQVLGLAK